VNAAVRDDFALGIAGFSFSDLYQPNRLRDLHERFWEFAAARQPDLAARFAGLPQGSLTPPEQSELLIEAAVHVGEFVAQLFAIGPEVETLRSETARLEAIFRCKQEFLRTRVYKHFGRAPATEAEFRSLDDEVHSLVAAIPAGDDAEVRFAETVLALLEGERSPDSELAARICAHRP